MAVTDPTAILQSNIAVGFTGGPQWNTSIVRGGGGYEYRNQVWERPLWTFKFTGAEKPLATLQTLQAFHIGRRGSARSWLLKDWADYSATGEVIGTGDGADKTFQVIKTYDTINPFVRNINYIKSGTLKVYLNGVQQTLTTHYSVSSTGLITFVSAPGNGVSITADFEFYVPVRFLQDICEIEITARTGEYGRVLALDAVEVLD